MIQIRNTRALREAIAKGQREFKLCLKFGLYSSKTITLRKDGRFRVENHIDDTVQILTEKQLHTHSNIVRGMRMGALLAHPPIGALSGKA